MQTPRSPFTIRCGRHRGLLIAIAVVGGLILNQGLVVAANEKELDEKARAAYRQYRRERYHTVFGVEKVFRWVRDLFLRDKYDKTENRRVPRIHFVGVWDTVSAYGAPLDESNRLRLFPFLPK